MTEVQFDRYNFRIQHRDGKQYIFDVVRKKEVALTPEEWVRQHWLHYFIYTLRYPASLMAVEKQIEVNDLRKRCDVVVYNNRLQPLLLVECKAPEEKVDEQVFMQAARYNLSLRVPYFLLSNGTHHFCCKTGEHFTMLNQVPDWQQLNAV